MATINHGQRFDRFRATDPAQGRGAQFDEFNRQSSNPHGPQSDENFGGAGGVDDDTHRQLDAVAAHIRGLPALHQRILCDKLGWSQGSGVDKKHDEMLDVFKADRVALGIEADDGDLHAALVGSVNKSLAAGAYGGRHAVAKVTPGVDVAKIRRR